MEPTHTKLVKMRWRHRETERKREREREITYPRKVEFQTPRTPKRTGMF